MERPSLPSSARSEWKHVIESCWKSESAQRMTPAQICELFASVQWMLVDGAEQKAIKACLKRFAEFEGHAPGARSRKGRRGL